ncbi:MAG: F0F1 ATP synthase subunit epsilon [Bacteroidales bacterium]
MMLRIISSDGILFDGEVKRVTLPGSLGSFTVLENHASLLSTLTVGELEYVAGGESVNIAIDGGFADINNNLVSVCLS